jgi:hypothetical protein
MIRNHKILRAFEDNFIREEGKLSFNQAIKLFTYMWHEAVKMGVLPPKEPLEGIEVDIKIAKVLNTCLKDSFPK